MWWESNDDEHDERCMADRCPYCNWPTYHGTTTRLRRRLGTHINKRRPTIRLIPRRQCLDCGFAADAWEFDASEKECICPELLEAAIEAMYDY